MRSKLTLGNEFLYCKLQQEESAAGGAIKEPCRTKRTHSALLRPNTVCLLSYIKRHKGMNRVLYYFISQWGLVVKGGLTSKTDTKRL